MFRRRSLDWNNYKAKQMVTNRVLFDFLSQYLSFSVITLSTPVVQWCRRSLHLNEGMWLGEKKKISQTHLANAKCPGLRFEMCFVGMGRRYETFPSMHWLSCRVWSGRQDNTWKQTNLELVSKCWDFPLFGTASLLRKYNKITAFNRCVLC